jgi:hypothetical protein
MIFAGPASAGRNLLAALLAREPAAGGQSHTDLLSRPQLEICVQQAKKLDAMERELDLKIAEIDRGVAEATFLKNILSSEMVAIGGYDEKAMTEFQKRLARYDQLARSFQSDFPTYQANIMAFEIQLSEFERDCGKPYRANDLTAVKEKLRLP